MKKFVTYCMGLSMAMSGMAYAQQEQSVRVMVLGSYHFANPGLDLIKTKVDDVLLPERQKQIQAVVDGVARFKPTKVAVEVNGDPYPNHAVPSYAKYLAERVSSSRNEIDQIGFRLAKQLGHQEVMGIDVDGDFPFEDVMKFANETGRQAELEALMKAAEQRGKTFEQKQKTQTISQILREMNLPAASQADHAWYVGVLNYGAGKQQPGAHLLGSWTERNLGICARLVQNAKPGDRIVVLYGAGHNYLLRRCVQEMPNWELVEANDFLP